MPGRAFIHARCGAKAQVNWHVILGVPGWWLCCLHAICNVVLPAVLLVSFVGGGFVTADGYEFEGCWASLEFLMPLWKIEVWKLSSCCWTSLPCGLQLSCSHQNTVKSHMVFYYTGVVV